MKLKFVFILFSFLSLAACNVGKQEKTAEKRNPYDLEIINDFEVYDSIVSLEPQKKLVDLEETVDNIVLDIRYASKNNFTGEVIYKIPKAFARKPVAVALQNVQKDLSSHGLGLKVFDAYRPYAATLKFYEVFPDTMYVAAPWHGSRHNRGCAVDITLLDLNTGEELNMPTPFDDFSDKAHPDYMELPEDVIKNRQMLIEIMKKHGFTVYPYEWWHYDFHGWENYKLMDISFEELINTK